MNNTTEMICPKCGAVIVKKGQHFPVGVTKIYCDCGGSVEILVKPEK